MKDRARRLRKDQTEAEKLLWSKIRNRYLQGYKFHRQYILGHYIVDFVCFECKIIIELDGSQHFDQKGYDEERTLVLNEMGFTVLRYWNNEIFTDLNAVIEKISQYLFEQIKIEDPHPNPLPQGERG
ncbi:MAG: endonuclease domain-containing protein [Gammaproteobacteria bacterium]|nr:endonuclease domain-containing protein [Gammaproteobacteria bacterium]